MQISLLNWILLQCCSFNNLAMQVQWFNIRTPATLQSFPCRSCNNQKDLVVTIATIRTLNSLPARFVVPREGKINWYTLHAALESTHLSWNLNSKEKGINNCYFKGTPCTTKQSIHKGNHFQPHTSYRLHHLLAGRAYQSCRWTGSHMWIVSSCELPLGLSTLKTYVVDVVSLVFLTTILIVFQPYPQQRKMGSMAKLSRVLSRNKYGSVEECPNDEMRNQHQRLALILMLWTGLWSNWQWKMGQAIAVVRVNYEPRDWRQSLSSVTVNNQWMSEKGMQGANQRVHAKGLIQRKQNCKNNTNALEELFNLWLISLSLNWFKPSAFVYIFWNPLGFEYPHSNPSSFSVAILCTTSDTNGGTLVHFILDLIPYCMLALFPTDYLPLLHSNLLIILIIYFEYMALFSCTCTLFASSFLHFPLWLVVARSLNTVNFLSSLNKLHLI